MRLLGIDPGLVNTGYALLEVERGKGRVLTSGVLSPPRDRSVERRIFFLYQGVQTIIEDHKVEETSLEDVFFAKVTPTILPMAQARGAIVAAVLSCVINLFSYTPTQVKQVIGGNGRATKADMAHMVGLHLRIDTASLPDHVTDAMAIALCHSLLRS